MLLSSPLMELESPDVSSELSELEVNSSEEVESSSEELTSDLEVNEVDFTETTAEIIYQTPYSSDDLVGIETSLQVIICLLFFIVIFIVCKICRSILDILGF